VVRIYIFIFFNFNNTFLNMVESMVPSFLFLSAGDCLWWLLVVAGDEHWWLREVF